MLYATDDILVHNVTGELIEIIKCGYSRYMIAIYLFNERRMCYYDIPFINFNFTKIGTL